MSDDKLLRMANDIAAFFRPYGEAEAIAGIRHHIASFWTPKMRATLEGRIGSGEVGGLDPVVARALSQAMDAGGPTERESAGPSEAGELGASDAG